MLSINPTRLRQTGLMQILRAIFRSNLAIISQKGGERCDGYSYWLNILLIEMLINPKHVFLSRFRSQTTKISSLEIQIEGGRIQVEKWAGREVASWLIRQTTEAGWMTREQVLHNVPSRNVGGVREAAGWWGFFSWYRCSLCLELGVCIFFFFLFPSKEGNKLTRSKQTFCFLFFLPGMWGEGNSPSVSPLPCEWGRSKRSCSDGN